MKRSTLAVAPVAMVLCSCISSSNVTDKASLPSREDEGIAIVGLKSQAKALFWMGDFKDGRFKADGFFPKGMQLASGEPYIVQSVAGTGSARPYGLISISVGDKLFGFGCGQDIPLLTVRRGAVQYFGDFTLVNEKGALSVRHTFDIDGAQAYIDKTYPGKGWKLEIGEIERAKVQECPTGPQIIYIFVPNRR